MTSKHIYNPTELRSVNSALVRAFETERKQKNTSRLKTRTDTIAIKNDGGGGLE